MAHNSTLQANKERGFTLLEMLIAMIISGIVVIGFATFFKQSLFGFLDLQADASTLNDLYIETSRVTNAIRGATGIVSAGPNDLVVYTYFYPSDSYVSLLHYYLVTNGGTTSLMADWTPMSANPPTGTPLSSQTHTVTIIKNYQAPQGASLFTYMNAGGSVITPPITDVSPIQAITVNLTETNSAGHTYSTSLQATLRNIVQ